MPLEEEVLRQTLGGVGLGTWLLLRESAPGYDPLSPEAPLIFAMSPMVGTPLTTSAKFAVVSKSPLTDRINDALSSSSFALAAKGAGLDALVVVGACEHPSVLILDGEAERMETYIEDANDLWGLSPAATDEALQTRLAAPRGRAHA
ncbi:MAG: aldehyde ferredoxin oxidoreductase N-terminal domain-containing protein, partial [Nitrospinota bacterium]